MTKKYVLGCDGGTGGMRVGVYDLSGNELAFAATEYETEFLHPGWAEQRPQDWWDALAQSTRKSIAQAGISKEEVLALSFDGTCGSVLLCKEDGTPIGNSMIWMDVRASTEAEEISRIDHPARKFSGEGNVSAEWIPCKALWLKKHRNEAYEAADVFCEYTDWLAFRLTGKWTANLSSIAARWYYDANAGGYPVDFYEKMGLGDLLKKFPKEIHALGDCLGRISPAAAAELDLPLDTIIGQGGVDASVGMFGLGVVRPGQYAMVTGSSHLLLGLTEKFVYGNGYFGPYPDAIRKGYGLIEGGQISSGSIVKWFKNNFCNDLDALPGGAYEYLNREAEKIAAGSDGVMVLDWWQGNRNPYSDPDIRGNIYGLSLGHTKAHLFRAIMEGVAYGTENIMQTFRRAGFAVTELNMSGGTTNSPLWMQIHADVSNVAVNIPRNVQAPALGSAILATMAAGIYSPEDAAANMVHYERVIEPDAQRHLVYQELFRQYEKAYRMMGDWMHETTNTFNRLRDTN